MQPNETMNLKTYVDADWCGNWNMAEGADDEGTAKCRSEYLIRFIKCPLIFSSKLQTLCTLSTTKADYVALRESQHETIPIMELIKEMKKGNIGTYISKSTDNVQRSRTI